MTALATIRSHVHPSRQHVRSARIALLGCGVVGREVARILIESQNQIRHTGGIRLELARVLVRDPARNRALDPILFTADFDDILSAEPDLVIEAMGGIEPAATYLRAALERGIPVVTANKSLIAHKGPELRELARKHGTNLAYEASVGGAIPVIAALRQLAGDEIQSIRAVLNGSCNYILTRMTEAKLSLDQALSEAIELGLVEPDPTADISGLDSAEKLCVLAAAIGFHDSTPNDVQTQGLEEVTPDDIAAARAHGFVIKLLAELEIIDGSLDLRVRPTLIPRSHPLAQARGAENAFVIESRCAGTLRLHGLGAGPTPTASALLGDVLRMLDAHGACEHHSVRPTSIRGRQSSSLRAQRYLIRLSGPSPQLKPDSVLNCLRLHGVHANQIECRHEGATLLTAPTRADRIIALSRELSARNIVRVFTAPLLE